MMQTRSARKGDRAFQAYREVSAAVHSGNADRVASALIGLTEMEKKVVRKTMEPVRF
jgi:hypothetical protein